jgi:Zn-finger nucleic acid-binding protein
VIAVPDFSRQVSTARFDRSAVPPGRGVHWNDLGELVRVLAMRRRTQAMPMREPSARA